MSDPQAGYASKEEAIDALFERKLQDPAGLKKLAQYAEQYVSDRCKDSPTGECSVPKKMMERVARILHVCAEGMP